MLRGGLIPCMVLVFYITSLSYFMWINFKKPNLCRVSGMNDVLSIQFAEYVRMYNKSYGAEEYYERQTYFEQSLLEISKLNSLQDSAVFGVTMFSDMSPEEKSRYTMGTVTKASCLNATRPSCPTPHKEKRERQSYYTMAFKDKKIPHKIDWRDRRVVGKVLSQKRCRGCWAFSIVGAMETMWAIQGHGLHELSIQEVIDCSIGNHKCAGGNVAIALDFLCQKDYPVVDDASYPLILVDQPCEVPELSPPRGRRIAEYTIVCSIDESEILRLIAFHGPVVALVDCSPWYFYTSGVVQKACNNQWDSVNHVVQIVGYDLTTEVPYYIVRNSWGATFGEDGYIRIAIYGNVCGIASSISYFTVK